MNTLKILAVISLFLVIIGFCLPWLEFYGPISGYKAVQMGTEFILSGHHIFSLINTIVFFAFIPFFTAMSIARIFFPVRKKANLLFYIIIIDLTALYALYMMSGLTSLKMIYPGFYIMIIGILILNIIVVRIYMGVRKEKSAQSTSP